MGKTEKAVTGDKNPGAKSLSPFSEEEGLGTQRGCPEPSTEAFSSRRPESNRGSPESSVRHLGLVILKG